MGNSGVISVYNARDYVGNIPLSYIVRPPSSMTGRMSFATWSPDGYALFGGYEKGWAIWSVYGKPGAHSFWAERDLIKRSPGEGYLDGVKDGCWFGGGQDLLLVKYKGDERLWALEMAKSAVTGCYNAVSCLERNLLYALMYCYTGKCITSSAPDERKAAHIPRV